MEFFLVKVNPDPDYPLEPPIGRSGRPETARQAYGIDAVNEFDPLFEDVYDYCEAQDIDVDTLTHESGAAQMEINFNHGAPLEIADQAFLETKTDIGAYFAVHKGMSDVVDATEAMLLFDGTDNGTNLAIAAIDGSYAQALDPAEGAFLMPLLVVIDDPFAIA